MKLLIISDTHGGVSIDNLKHFEEAVLNCDFIISLGDVDLFLLKYLKSISKDNIFGILGNHDKKNYLELSEITDLNGKIINLSNISIAGIEGSWKYKEGDFPNFTDDESIDFLNDIPKVDILFSHDSIKNLHNKSWAHPGLSGITKYIQEKKPAFNIHGHHHENKVYKLKDTIIVGIYSLVILEINKSNSVLDIKRNILIDNNQY